jgi:hypothetical protein
MKNFGRNPLTLHGLYLKALSKSSEDAKAQAFVKYYEREYPKYMCRSREQIQSKDRLGQVDLVTDPFLCASIAFCRVVDIVYTHIYNLGVIFDPSGQQRLQLESVLQPMCDELSQLIPQIDHCKRLRQQRNGAEQVGCQGQLSRWLHEFRIRTLTCLSRDWNQQQRAEYVAWAVQRTPILKICEDVMECIRSHNGCAITRMSIKLGPDDHGNDFGHYECVEDLPMVRPHVLF